MKRRLIVLLIAAALVLALPFLYGKLRQPPSEGPAREETPVPSATPMPTHAVVEIVIPEPGSAEAPAVIRTPEASARTPQPEAYEPAGTAEASPVSGTPGKPVKEGPVSVPKGAAFVLTVNGKDITVAGSIDEKTLEKSPGWLDSSAKPGGEGVCVVYGHRNRNHLQVLKDVDYGDPIRVTAPDGSVYTYITESTEILESDEELRIPAIEGKHLMLTTCYPFYYTGHAPKKYVVIAVLDSAGPSPA